LGFRAKLKFESGKIIDGYNFIGSDPGLIGTLEHMRNWLVPEKSRPITGSKDRDIRVVFDGWRLEVRNAVERFGVVALTELVISPSVRCG
jgi:hypothetical protein